MYVHIWIWPVCFCFCSFLAIAYSHIFAHSNTLHINRTIFFLSLEIETGEIGDVNKMKRKKEHCFIYYHHCWAITITVWVRMYISMEEKKRVMIAFHLELHSTVFWCFFFSFFSLLPFISLTHSLTHSHIYFHCLIEKRDEKMVFGLFIHVNFFFNDERRRRKSIPFWKHDSILLV